MGVSFLGSLETWRRRARGSQHQTPRSKNTGAIRTVPHLAVLGCHDSKIDQLSKHPWARRAGAPDCRELSGRFGVAHQCPSRRSVMRKTILAFSVLFLAP